MKAIRVLSILLAVVLLLLAAVTCKTPIEASFARASAIRSLQATATYGASLFQQQRTAWAATPTPAP